MPPLIAAVLIGAGAWAGYRAARHLLRATGIHGGAGGGGPNGADGAESVAEKDLGVLEYDPASGVYRPSRRER